MTENDDKLLADFFATHRQEIADNGFTHRVMHRLPGRTRRLSRLWTPLGIAATAALFVAMDGIPAVMHTLQEAFTSSAGVELMQSDPKSLLLAGGVLLFLFYRKVSSWA